MKRFEHAIRAIQNELYRRAGMAAIEYANNKHLPINMASETKEVLNMQEAIKILDEHFRNKHIT